MTRYQLVPTRLVRPQSEVVSQIRDLMVEAFGDQEPWVCMFSDARARSRLMPWFFERRLLLWIDESYVLLEAEDGEAEADRDNIRELKPGELILGHTALQSPQSSSKNPSTWRMVQLGLLMWPFYFGLNSFFTFMSFLSLWDKLKQNASETCDLHWQMEAVIIRPSLRSQGLGKFMVKRMLDSVPEGDQVMLATQKESNVAFYSRVGFEVIVSEQVAFNSGNFSNWFMLCKK